MIKILFCSLFLLALCTARLTIPINQPSIPHPVLNKNNMAQAFLNADDDSASKVLNVTANNTDNLLYGDLYVGKSTKFKVFFQTAVDKTWLPQHFCAGCPTKARYACEESPTCDLIEEYETVHYRYRDDFTVKGYPGHEMIGLTQDFQVKSQVLWAGFVKIKNGDGLWMPAKIDGYLGLGSSQANDGYIDQLYQQNYIQDKVFSFYFNYNLNQEAVEMVNSSFLSIGYIPEEKVNKLTWVSIKSDSQFSWTLRVSSVKVGDKIVDTSSEPYANEVSIDSGTPELYLAPSIIKMLHSQLKEFETEDVSGNTGPYYVCNDNHIDEFPNITLKVGNMDLNLNVYTYLELASARTSVRYGKTYCSLLVRESQNGTQILGSTFLINNFVAFSKANQTVGIFQEYKPIRFGRYKTWFEIYLPYALGVALLIVIIVVIKKKKATDNLKKELNADSSDVYSSQIGIN